MRNLFDQYSQPENRITHALAVVLHEEPKLLRSFLREIAAAHPPAHAPLRVVEQRLPGGPEPDDERERGGLPDLWIHDRDERWALLVECKVAAELTADQMRRHRRTAEKRGFVKLELLAITARPPRVRLPREVRTVLWSEVFAWAYQHHAGQPWARRLIDYLQIAERKMTDEGYLTEGSLSTFTGVPFGDGEPYHYGEAKRVLRLMLGELKKRPDLRAIGLRAGAQGRPAITGVRAELVWDFLPLGHGGPAFTSRPHLTLSLHSDHVGAMITLPNGMDNPRRKRLLEGELQGFLELITECGRRLLKVAKRAPGAKPTIYLLQHHYHSQRSRPTRDARMDVDLRTVLASPRTPIDGVKYQPEWLEALYLAYSNRRSNMQLGIGVDFRYGDPTRSVKVLDLVADTWKACKPVLERTLQGGLRNLDRRG